MIDLSIIIPLYNHENEISRCLDSLIGLNLTHAEIIVVNDGSTDNSLFICEQYQNKHSYIHTYSKTNGGVSSARNFGIEKSKGEYILFCDPDDSVNQNIDILDIINKMAEKNYDLCVLNHNIVKNGIKLLNKKFPKNNVIIDTKKGIEHYKASIFSGSVNDFNIDYFYGCNFVWGKIYKKTIIRENNIVFNEKVFFSEDFLFNLEYCNYIKKICIMNIPFYNYYVYSGNTTLSYKANLIENYDEINKILEKQYKNYDSKSINLLWARIIRNLSTICKNNLFHKENKKNTISLKQLINEKEVYKKAIKNVKFKDLTFKQKIFVFLLRLRLYFIIKILV